MMRNRDAVAMLFLPRCVGHRFREPDGFVVSQCRSSVLRPRMAPSSRPRRSTGRCTFSKRLGSSRWASVCRTL